LFAQNDAPAADGGGVGDESEGIAVGWRREHRTRCRYGAGARPVVDDETLAELAAEFFRDQPRSDVTDASRTERHADPHRPIRIILCSRRRHQQSCRDGGKKHQSPASHVQAPSGKTPLEKPHYAINVQARKCRIWLRTLARQRLVRAVA
jgi:hypothetical protein